MKLLLDQNVSHKLVSLLADLYPDTIHMRSISLTASDDTAIWDFARQHDFVLVSKDEDFHVRSLLIGPPPKVLWVRSGNCSTELIETLLRKNYALIEQFVTEAISGFLILQ